MKILKLIKGLNFALFVSEKKKINLEKCKKN